MPKIIVTLSGSWVLSRRNDDMLPVDFVVKKLKEHFGTDVTIEDEGLTQFVDSYSEKVDGKEYYVEEYNDREFVTSKFYFDGEELVMLKVTDVSTLSVQYTYFDEISFEVEDDFFKIPKGAFDLSPILTALIISLIATA